jgi:hypothetical protein
MAEIDASIPLRVQSPKFMTPAEGISLQNLARQGQLQQTQLEEAQQAQQQKNQLRQVMQGATDPTTGRLTPQGLSQITQLDPAMGLQLGQQQEQLRLKDLAFNQKKEDLKKHVGISYVSAYDRYLQQNGGNTQAAQDLAKADAIEAVSEMERSGTLAALGMDGTSIKKLKTLPGPEQMRALVVSLGGTVPSIEHKDETPYMKDLKALLRSKGFTPGTPEYQKEFSAALGRRTAREEAPTATMMNVNTTAGTGKSYIPEEHADLHGEDYLAKLPPGVRSSVKAIAEGRASLNTLSIKGGEREAMLQRVSQYDPTFDASNAGARAAVRKDFTSGKAAGNVTAINTAIGHIGSLDELGDALKNRDTRVLNSVINRIATETGNADVNNFELARDAVAHELVRVFRSVGASQKEQEEFASRFKAANSPEQMKGAVKTSAELLQSRINALDDQWKRGMNLKTGYPDLLSPKSAKIMERVGSYGGKPAGAPGARSSVRDEADAILRGGN